MHWGAYSDGDSGCYTSEDDYGADKGTTRDIVDGDGGRV